MPSMLRVGSLASLALMPGPHLTGQPTAFRYDPARVQIGRVYQYVKSNRDGSHPGRVTVYVAKQDQLESLKWDDEVGWATYVVAQLDWSRFSVRRFESWDLRRAKPPLLKAILDTDPDGAVSVSILPGPPLRLTLWPWHSYDFDFASLGATLPHLADPEAAFSLGRSDFTQDDGKPAFRELGPVRVRHEGREVRGGVQTRRYQIGGPGLADTTGTLWADAEAGHIVEFELPIPDEPGFDDGRLRLIEVGRMTPAEWEAFKRSRLGE